MNTSLVLMSKLFSMMIIAAVGLGTIRIGLLEERDRRQLAKLSLYVLQPCLIIMSFQIELTQERLKGFGLAVIFSALIHFGFIFAAEILERIGLIDAVEELTIVYTNCGNLILPIVSMTLGPEMTFYASAFPIMFNILFWTHGVSRMSGGGFDWRKLVFNTNIIALFTGLLLMLLQIPIPGVLKTSMEMFSDMLGPTSMLVIGMTMAGADYKEMLSYKKAWLVIFLRLIGFPLMAIAVLRLSGFLTWHPEYIPILRVSFMAVAAPSAANVAQVAVIYDRHPAKAGFYNILGMLLCVLTMPLIDYVYALVFTA